MKPSKCNIHRFSNPKELYLYAKNVLKTRYEEAEDKIVRPYNYRIKKYVTKQEEHHEYMFAYATAYLRNILIGRSPQIVINEYKTKLEKNLFKFFNCWSVLNYASIFRDRLPEELHNRFLAECMIDKTGSSAMSRYNKLCLLDKREKHKGSFLSKNQIVHNLLLENPKLIPEEATVALKKIGILVTVTEAKRIISCVKMKIGLEHLDLRFLP